jgi:hypothetical protein
MPPIPIELPIHEIAGSASAFLTPLLPYLVGSLSGAAITKAGEKAAGKAVEKIGEKVGEGVWERAKHLWGKFRPKIEESDQTEAMVELAVKVEKKPQEIGEVTDALQSKLMPWLEADPKLTQQVALIIQETQNEYNNGAIFSIHSQWAKNIINAYRIDNVNMN